jgi:serine/threonine protein kinase
MMHDIVDDRKPIPMKNFFSANASNLLTRLLERDPAKRIGSKNDAMELMEHPFFDGLEWDDIANKRHDMPWKPKIKHAEDTSNIDKLFTRETVKETPVLDSAMNMHQK